MPADPTPPALPGVAPPVPEQAGQPPPPKSPKRGCLIAVVVAVVLFIIAIPIVALLAGIAVPAIVAIKKKMKKDQARALAMSVVSSCKGYYAEYQKYPAPNEEAAAEVDPLRTDDVLTGILLGTDIARNPKKINFLPDLKPVERGHGFGLLTEDNATSIVDPWGEPFYVLMDTDYSTTIENPNADSMISKLHQGILVYSAGPDHNPATWADNVGSWNSADPTRQTSQPDDIPNQPN
jgi:type II secretory pathway pseudopilin PulG